jgi:transposase-like protein
MSKARLIITAVVVEGRSKSEVARDYDVSRFWVRQLVTRYKSEGEAAFEPRSRRPHTSPGAVSVELEDEIVRFRKELSRQGLDAGADTIRTHLARSAARRTRQVRPSRPPGPGVEDLHVATRTTRGSRRSGGSSSAAGSSPRSRRNDPGHRGAGSPPSSRTNVGRPTPPTSQTLAARRRRRCGDPEPPRRPLPAFTRVPPAAHHHRP